MWTWFLGLVFHYLNMVISVLLYFQLRYKSKCCIFSFSTVSLYVSYQQVHLLHAVTLNVSRGGAHLSSNVHGASVFLSFIGCRCNCTSSATSTCVLQFSLLPCPQQIQKLSGMVRKEWRLRWRVFWSFYFWLPHQKYVWLFYVCVSFFYYVQDVT